MRRQPGSRVFPVTINVLTDAASAFTGYSDYLSGKVLGVAYIKTDFTDGVDFTITTETTAQTLWTESNVNAAAVKYPRVPTVDGIAAASLYAAAGEAVETEPVLFAERIKVVIAAGGAAKTGKLIFVIEG